MIEKIKANRNIIIVITSITLITAFSLFFAPRILNVLFKKEILVNQESELKTAAKEFFSVNDIVLPKEIGEVKKVTLTSLKRYGYINGIFDKKDKECDSDLSYVEVKKLDDKVYAYYPYLVCDNYVSKATWSTWSTWSTTKPKEADNKEIESMLLYNYSEKSQETKDWSAWENIDSKKEQPGYEYKYQTLYKYQDKMWKWYNKEGKEYADGYYTSAPSGYPNKDDSLNQTQYKYSMTTTELAGNGAYYEKDNQPSNYTKEVNSKTQYKYTRKNGKVYATGGFAGYYTDAEGANLIKQGYIKDTSSSKIQYKYTKEETKLAGNGTYYTDTEAEPLISEGYSKTENKQEYWGTFYKVDSGKTVTATSNVYVKYKTGQGYRNLSCSIGSDYVKQTYECTNTDNCYTDAKTGMYNYLKNNYSVYSDWINNFSASNTYTTKLYKLYAYKVYCSYAPPKGSNASWYYEIGLGKDASTSACSATKVVNKITYNSPIMYKYEKVFYDNGGKYTSDYNQSPYVSETRYKELGSIYNIFPNSLKYSIWYMFKFNIIINELSSSRNKLVSDMCSKDVFDHIDWDKDYKRLDSGITITAGDDLGSAGYNGYNHILAYYSNKKYKYQYSKKVTENYDNGNWADKTPSEMSGWNKTSEQTLYKYYKTGEENYDNGNWTDKTPSEMNGWEQTNKRTVYQYSKQTTKTTDWTTNNPGKDYSIADSRTVYKFYKSTGSATTNEYYSEEPVGYPIKLEDQSTLSGWSELSDKKPEEKVYRTIREQLQMKSRKVNINSNILSEYVTKKELEKIVGKTLEEIENDNNLSYTKQVMYRYRIRE